MKSSTIMATLTSFFLLIAATQVCAELIIGSDQVRGPSEGSKITPIEILLTGETTGTPITGLTKSNFRFVIARDTLTGDVRTIRWDVVPLSIPGAYRMKITPVGWEYYDYNTGNGSCHGLTALFRVTTGNGASSGGVSIYTSASYY